ncbi:MAG: hypothetical protein K2X59_11095, partial [Sphingomonas sp.]|nr:hypothetical protein [Sphingomonas sp.]
IAKTPLMMTRAAMIATSIQGKGGSGAMALSRPLQRIGALNNMPHQLRSKALSAVLQKSP